MSINSGFGLITTNAVCPPSPARKKARPSFSAGLLFSNSFSSSSPPSLSGRVFFGSKGSELSSFLQKIEEISSSLSIIRQGQRFELRRIGRGDYSDVYLLQESPHSFMEGILNDGFVIKMFRCDLFMEANKRQHSAKKAIEAQWLPNTLKQQAQLEAGGLSVAKIYNKDSVREDGYFIVEKAAPLAQIPLWENAGLPKDKDVLSILEQLEKFFEYAFKDKSKLPLDLQLSNLGLRDGRVILFDFKEEEEDMDSAFSIIARQCLTSCSKGNKDVYAYLCDSIKGSALYNHLMDV